MKLKFFCAVLFVAGSCFLPIFAQSAQKIESFRDGESLTYEGKFSKAIFRGIGVADFNFTVERAANKRDYSVKTEAKSKGTLSKILNFDFYQRIESTIDDKNFNILNTVKRDEQDNRVRESEALFDYKNRRVVYVETDPNDAARAPRSVASPIKEDTQDLVSALYALRRLPLAVGEKFEVTVSDSGLVYKVPVRVTARELQKSVLGKTWCFRVEPEIFGENRLIEQKGSLIIWISDDHRRLPVRAQINANIGRIEVKLKSVNYKSKSQTAK